MKQYRDHWEQYRNHCIFMHEHNGWPHPDEYRYIHQSVKPMMERAFDGLHDIYSDETITATVDDLIKQHTLVSPEDAAELRRMVNG